MNDIISIPDNFNAAEDCLKDRVIMVTGSSDGIGAAAAKTFASHGATVILHGKTIPKLEQVYDEIKAAGDAEPAIIPLDLETLNVEQANEVALKIEDEFGQLDGLLHNAALFAGLSPISQFDTEIWDKTIRVNLHAPFLLSRALLPVMNKSNSASLIFTSSGVARKGRAYWGAYGVSKAAGDNLMGILADELEANTPIRVNSIDPGRVRTRMRALAYPGEAPEVNPAPEEIMAPYLYLMSDASKDVNGKIITCY